MTPPARPDRVPRAIPKPDSIALTWLRERLGWSQTQLAQAAGTVRNLITDYERGNRPLSRRRFLQLAAAMAYTPAQIELALLAIAAVGPDPAGGDAAATGPAALPPAEARLHRQAIAHLAVEVAALALPRLKPRIAEHRLAQARAQAASLWRRLQVASPAQRRLLVERLEEFQGWALAELLAHQSQRTAPAGAADALDLAQLAVTAARLAAGSAAWRSRVQGYARAYLANALQAAGHAAAASAEWQTAWSLWRAGAAGDPAGVLSEGCLLDLSASIGLDAPTVASAPGDRHGLPPSAAGSASSRPGTAPERKGDAAAGDALPDSRDTARIALIWLRERIAWTQQDLAAAAGVHTSHISGFERGHRPLTPRRFQTLTSEVMGYTPADVDVALLTVAALDPSPAGTVAAAAHPAAAAPLDDHLARQTASHLGVEYATLAQFRLQARSAAHHIARARAAAGRQWQTLARFKPAQRRLLVQGLLQLRGWALAERLAEESRRAAPRSATTALELAGLAVTVARLAAGSDAWRSRLEGYARAFLANALRIQGSLPQADAQWRMVRRLWHAGAAGDPTAILPEWRLLDLEASLRRDAGHFGVALDLLDRAAAAAPRAAAGRILLKRGSTLEQAGDATAAAAALREAAPLVIETGDLRLQFGLEFTLTAVLCHLGAFADASAQLPRLRHLTLELANDLDVLRVSWLAARVAAGMGNRQEASAAFSHVREQFADRGNGVASAMVSLDLAILYLEEGRLAEVRRLAQKIWKVLAAQKVEREAVASLKLFCEAANREVATIEQARTALRLLDRSSRARFSLP